MSFDTQLIKNAIEKIDGVKGTFVVCLDDDGKVSVSDASNPILIKVNSQESWEASVDNHPDGLQFDIRDYGVDGVDKSDLEIDDDGEQFKSMY